MNIIQKKVKELIPYAFNNKVHNEVQIDRIANSIKEFGFSQPIVTDWNNIIIIWHWRLEAAKKLWLKEVPVVVMDTLTETQIKKLRILDNKLNESDWNLENLKLELDQLKDMNIWELELSVIELFPEFENNDFDPDEYRESTNDRTWEIVIKVMAKDEWEASLIRADLENLWYNFK